AKLIKEEEAKQEAQKQAKVKSESESKSDSETETKSESKKEPVSEPEQESKSQPKPKPKKETKPESKTETNSDTSNNSTASPSTDSGGGIYAWPTEGGYISSSQGQRWGRAHKGIDIARTDRSTSPPIYAAESGTIKSAGTMNGYGNTIVIDHGNGMETLYAHMSSMNVSTG